MTKKNVILCTNGAISNYPAVIMHEGKPLFCLNGYELAYHCPCSRFQKSDQKIGFVILFA